MNKQSQIQNLNTMIALWYVAILTSQKEIENAEAIIGQLEEQIKQLREENDVDNSEL